MTSPVSDALLAEIVRRIAVRGDVVPTTISSRLIGGNVRVGPLGVLAPIRLAIAPKTRIEDDEVNAPAVERVVRLLLSHPVEELLLGERVDTMVAQGVVPVLRELKTPCRFA
jgi:hypothetical protein